MAKNDRDNPRAESERPSSTLRALGTESPASRRLSKFESRDPLERARQTAQDARDLARDARKQLPSYDADSEESTARHDIPSIHVHLDSVHDSDPPAKKQIKAGLIALGTGIGLALVTAITAIAQSCSHR